MITQCPKTGRTCEVTGCDGCWKAEQAEQEPVAVVGFDTKGWRNLVDALTKLPDGQPLYTHPVRTKDLTADEIWEALHDKGLMEGIRAVIAADREKNK